MNDCGAVSGVSAGEYLASRLSPVSGQTEPAGGEERQSVLVTDTDNNMLATRPEPSPSYLETSFWNEQPPNESDDDEGIGSDESVDQADPHHQCHCSSQQPAPRTREMSQQTKEPGLSTLSVTKFLRVLKQSVKRDTGLRSAIVQSPTVVFGLDLTSHLTACRTSVPDVVRRVRLSHFV